MKRRIAPFPSAGPLPAWWAPLFEASGSDSVFLSPVWMRNWIDVYGAGFSGSWVHWEHGGRVVAGCLLVERLVRVKGVPFRSQFLNATGKAESPTPLAEFNDVLHLPGHADAVAADFVRLLQERAWGRLLLSGHEPDGVAVVPQDLWRDDLATMATAEKIELAKELERLTLAADARVRVDEADYADVQAFAPKCFEAVDPRDRGDDPDIHAQVWDRLHSTWVGVKPGMWIVRGIRGEFYPIDDGVLADTYEEVSNA